MAKKKVVRKAKPVTRTKSKATGRVTYATIEHDFIIIAGGGLVVLILVVFFFLGGF